MGSYEKAVIVAAALALEWLLLLYMHSLRIFLKLQAIRPDTVNEDEVMEID